MTPSIIQISDSHISLQHPQRTRDLANCIDQINALPNQPDLVIHTGDVAHDGLAEEYLAARSELDRLAAPYRVLTGNRDNRTRLLDTFADVNNLKPDSPFIQFTIDDFSVRLLVLDTLSGSSNKGELCPARFDELRTMLQSHRQRKTAIFMHHPPFEAGEIPDPFQFEQWSIVEDFHKLIALHDNIVAIYCGHVHRNIDSQVGKVPASALTCMAGDLRKGNISEEDRTTVEFKPIQF